MAVKVGADGASVVLDLDPNTKLTPNTLYTATVQNLTDLKGNLIDPASKNVTFRSYVLSQFLVPHAPRSPSRYPG